MPEKTPKDSTHGPHPLEADPVQVAGGADCVSPAGPPDVTGTYDALVDATSAVIERVVTATKSY